RIGHRRAVRRGNAWYGFAAQQLLRVRAGAAARTATAAPVSWRRVTTAAAATSGGWRRILAGIAQPESARDRRACRVIVARVGDVQEDVTQLRVERERSPCADWRPKRDHRFVLRRPIQWSTRKDVVLVPEIATELLDLRRHLVDVRSGHTEATSRRRLDGERLRWPVLVVGHTGSVDRLLDDLVQRFSCDAIEHVDEVELAGLQNGGNGTTVDLHVDQDRRRWHVPVGRVVMHQLVKPLQPAGLRIERDQRIAVQIAALDRTIRSEERRVGKESRARWATQHEKNKQKAKNNTSE